MPGEIIPLLHVGYVAAPLTGEQDLPARPWHLFQDGDPGPASGWQGLYCSISSQKTSRPTSNYDNVRFHLFSGVLQIYSVLQKKSLYLQSISTRNAASHFSSAVEQRIRNAQVGSSNLPSGSINLIPDKNTLPECLGTLRSQDDAIVP